jgi:mono/diheme cytochrome c family protein
MKTFCLVASLLLASTGSVGAQDVSFGKAEFVERCAVCHGEEGSGDGLVGELFRQKPKNLQIIAKENGGVFPFDVVIASIDGRRDIAGHGDSNMPVWGDYLMAESLESRNINPKDAATVTHARILAISFYLESIQAK